MNFDLDLVPTQNSLLQKKTTVIYIPSLLQINKNNVDCQDTKWNMYGIVSEIIQTKYNNNKENKVQCKQLLIKTSNLFSRVMVQNFG